MYNNNNNKKHREYSLGVQKGNLIKYWGSAVVGVEFE